MRTRAESINRQGRGTQGVSVMNIEEGDALASIAQIDLDDRPTPPEPPPEPDAPEEPPDTQPEPSGEPAASADPEPAADESPARRAAEIDDVPAQEIRAAIESVLAGDEWMPPDDMLRAIARELRFTRLSPRVRESLERAVHQAILDGAVEENASRELRLPQA